MVKWLLFYYCFLKNLYVLGKQCVFLVELSDVVKVDLVMICWDFFYFGVFGKKGYGYNVDYLLLFFRKILDQDEMINVILIGVGNLGIVFFYYNFIKNNNIKIFMVFDVNQSKIGIEVGGVFVFDFDDLEFYIKDEFVVIFIVLVVVVQLIIDWFVVFGIKGIFNFMLVCLNVLDYI